MKNNLMRFGAALIASVLFAISTQAQSFETDNRGHYIIPDAFDCKTQYYSEAKDNWFVQIGAGITIPVVENYVPGEKSNRQVTAVYNIGGGRWFSPYVGVRLGINYGAMHWNYMNYSKARFANLTADVMWDMFNTIGGVDPDRPFSVVPFAGFGGAYTWKIRSAASNIQFPGGSVKNSSWTLPVSAGFQFRFRISRHVDFYLECRAYFYGDNFNGCAVDCPVDMNVQTTGGFSVNIGGVRFNAHNPCKAVAYVNSLNEQVNTLRKQLSETSRALAEAQTQLPCPEMPDVKSDTVKLPSLMPAVVFNLNSAHVPAGQMANIHNVAQYLKDNPGVKITVRGYADRETGSETYNRMLSEKRANAVAGLLVRQFCVEESRIKVIAEGCASQPFDNEKWNRAVVFTVSE